MLLMRVLYSPFMRNNDGLVLLDVRGAEFTQYATSAMLATRIRFRNGLARLADAVGAYLEWVRKGIGSDPRIGTHFLYSGAGYGGSLFPKVVSALIRTVRDLGVPLRVLQAVEDARDAQKQILVERVVPRFGDDLAGRTFALWGLAFKLNTDDITEAAAGAGRPQPLPSRVDEGAGHRFRGGREGCGAHGLVGATCLAPGCHDPHADPRSHGGVTLTDTHLVVRAQQHAATISICDRDFQRFSRARVDGLGQN
jgi:hypothetical protein